MGVVVAFLEEQKPAASTEEPGRGVVVPAADLRKEGDRDVVFVLKERRAQRRTVTLGGAIGDSRQGLAGVSPGEAVIVDAPAGLKDGAAATAGRPGSIRPATAQSSLPLWPRAEGVISESMGQVR